MLKINRIGVKILKMILKIESIEEKVSKCIIQELKIRDMESVKKRNGFMIRLKKVLFWKSQRQKMLEVTEREKIIIERKMKGLKPEQRARPQ